MRYSGEPAYVLHARAYRETSVLVEVLTPHHGRLGLLARGVRGPKKHALKAALAPGQYIRFDAEQRGELARLIQAEALDRGISLAGERLLAAFYQNELTLRLAPRFDAQPELFVSFGRTRALLSAGAPIAWTLRRFERDLLDALGLAPDWAHDALGAFIENTMHYRFDFERGFVPRAADKYSADDGLVISGEALVALASDAQPDTHTSNAIRRLMRALILHQLGGKGLKSWDMLAELRQIQSS